MDQRWLVRLVDIRSNNDRQMVEGGTNRRTETKRNMQAWECAVDEKRCTSKVNEMEQ